MNDRETAPSLREALLALADDLDNRSAKLRGCFYLEARAYADGQESGWQGAADKIRNLLNETEDRDDLRETLRELANDLDFLEATPLSSSREATAYASGQESGWMIAADKIRALLDRDSVNEN